mmetsp:Transcript_12420/g.22148  ORF Transcript_12420/g.22148 Transcript_12420/m.22148 type:complete len:449 (+) Transcript_12420:1-1347(+)
MQVLEHPWIRKLAVTLNKPQDVKRLTKAELQQPTQHVSKTANKEISTQRPKDESVIAEQLATRTKKREGYEESTESHRAVATALLAASLLQKTQQDLVPRNDFLRFSYEILGSEDWRFNLSFEKDGSLKTRKSQRTLASDGISFEEFENTVRKFHTVKFDEDSVVFHEGDQVEGIFVVINGKAQVEYKDQDGEPFVVAELERGDIFGETAILDGRDVRHATVRCKTPVEAVFWSRDDFIRTHGTSALCSGLQEHVRVRQNSRAWKKLIRAIGKENLREKELHRGDVLYEQGDPAECLYLVISGQIETRVEKNRRGRDVVQKLKRLVSRFVADKRNEADRPVKPGMPIRQYHKGGLFGTACVSGAPHGATAMCVSKSARVIAVDAKSLLELLETDPSLRRHLLRLGRRDTEERIAILRSLENGAAPPEHGELDLAELIKVVQDYKRAPN